MGVAVALVVAAGPHGKAVTRLVELSPRRTPAPGRVVPMPSALRAPAAADRAFARTHWINIRQSYCT